MNILISDVWSAHNTGDAAILEALVSGLRRLDSEARLTVAAHYPSSCAALAGVRVIQDVLAFDEAGLDTQTAHLPGQSAELDRLRAAYAEADLVVSTGGYFLNALPGNPFTYVLLSRLLHLAWARQAGARTAILGQSVGPFGDATLRALACQALGDVDLLTVRDAQSWSYLHTSGIARGAQLTADLAVVLEAAPEEEVRAAMRRLELPMDALAISARTYAGTPPDAFEHLARVADRAVEEHDVDVLLIGTTIPSSSLGDGLARERALGNDDLVALQAVHGSMRHAERAVVCAESLPPRLLKGVLSTSRALLATRMHAAILGSTAGVPTAGIAYEFKVEGWFDQLGLPDLSLPLAEVTSDRTDEIVRTLLADGSALREHLARVLPDVRQRSHQNFALLEPLLQRARRCDRQARSRWQGEALHYDVPHRRLERISGLVTERGPGRVLDLGCSAGTLGRILGESYTYHGCDVSEEAVHTPGPGWRVVHDLEGGLPEFDSGPYDTVVASGIFEYLQDVPALLKRIRSRLSRDGRLVASYFNMDHVSRRAGDAFRHELWVNDWRPSEFRALLEAAGFEIERVTWSTASTASAPDVRDEGEAIRSEAALALEVDNLDDLCHTLIYRCRIASRVHDEPRGALPASTLQTSRSGG